MSGAVENAQIAVLSLVTGEIEVLIPGGSNPSYAPTGHIVYGVDGTLQAVGFDLDRLEVTSDPIPVLDGVITKATGAAEFGISGDGSLASITGDLQTGRTLTLVWVDREGREDPVVAAPQAYQEFTLSPDGTQLAVRVTGDNTDVWIYDLLRDTSTRLTFDPAGERFPLWTPDGQRVGGCQEIS